MAVTITINGLTLCHQGSGGIIHNTLPDVCKTPDKGVPVPYQNEAYSKDLINGTTSCFADGGHMIANLGSKFAVSVFDEPGAMGGVVSGTSKAEAEWISHSFDVFFEGKPACRLTDKMFMNHRNTASLAGLVQPHLSGYTGRDLIIEAVCEVFCTVRREGMDAKAEKSPDKRFNYSKRAKELSAQHPGLNKLSIEKQFLHAVDKADSTLLKTLKEAGRKAVPISAIKSRLVTEAMKNAGEQVIKRTAKKALLKFIPVVNVLSTAWDVYDMASTGYKALKEVSARLAVYDPAKATTFRARPDLVNVDPATGKPTQI
ncbi:MAG: DUF4150 domain-containing protein, partial [Candidatus Thiodiazotropha sp. (ex Epidulcina cf. delphinae)]|nr:DUF4150 domain-containing protein [Candidatus Thiodiazotropha sp. (ex Epidulcina cf. delphinae)]